MFGFLNKQIAAATHTVRMGDDMDADREMAAMQAAADKVSFFLQKYNISIQNK